MVHGWKDREGERRSEIHQSKDRENVRMNASLERARKEKGERAQREDGSEGKKSYHTIYLSYGIVRRDDNALC